jgi:hypothetical protein
MSIAKSVLANLRQQGTGVHISCADCFDSIPLCAECYLARKEVTQRMKCTPCKVKAKKEYKCSFLERRNSADRAKRWRERKKAEKEKLKLITQEEEPTRPVDPEDNTVGQSCPDLGIAIPTTPSKPKLPTPSSHASASSSTIKSMNMPDTFEKNKSDTEPTQDPRLL